MNYSISLRSISLRSTILILAVLVLPYAASSQDKRRFSGVVVSSQFEFVPNYSFEVATSEGSMKVTTDAEGSFATTVPSTGDLTVRIVGKNIETYEQIFSVDDPIENVRLRINYVVSAVAENVTITAETLTPDLELRNDAIYRNSLFGRDDQIIFTLNAGINAGQHEGGGKSLEIRRFGFNTDHGGVNGGVKILVDNIQQNQGTQGHGQGYLGNLKSLSPELVKDVSIINGPFSAAYGDFSGLGVVQISLKESLPDIFTARIQAGSHSTVRGFFAYSPNWKDTDAFIAYEPSYTDGPFQNPLKYRRDNVSGNVTRRLGDGQAIGFKFNVGRNNFFSSGQIPLDLVADGSLDRFGAIDPENGGRIKLGTFGGFYRKELDSGATLKVDAFVGRSLFDLFSNFTFNLADPVYGDEIQQHDSRLQQGSNVQFLLPYKLGNVQSLLTVGGGFLLNQINVGLNPTVSRDPSRKFFAGNFDNANVLLTKANARVNNYSFYVQNMFAFFDGHLRIDAGLRFDRFSLDVDGFEFGSLNPDNPGFAQCTPTSPRSCGDILSGKDAAGEFQPKLAVAWSPFENTPISLYANYGRGISSQDARGVVRNPDAPKISTTDFYQVGASYNSRRFSLVFSSFLIDRSNEQVYIPDDGSIEFAERSRSYGLEIRNSIRFNRFLSFNGGLTQVIRSFYPGQFTEDGRRIVVDSAPKTVANAGVVFNELRGFNFSVNWRHINSYRLDGEDPMLKAAGHDVVDLFLTKRLKKWIELNFAIDNVFNKRYFETQNFFESRVLPGEKSPIGERIHATPGYPFTVSAGVTFRFGSKN
jgi:Outer membrane receptor proteins, mostly Fe transport